MVKLVVHQQIRYYYSQNHFHMKKRGYYEYERIQ